MVAALLAGALVAGCGDSATTAARGATDDSASPGGWTTLATPNQSVNLLAYQAGAALPLGSKSIVAGSYLGFRLVIDGTRSSVTGSRIENSSSMPTVRSLAAANISTARSRSIVDIDQAR